jgi:hypothetical protein
MAPRSVRFSVRSWKLSKVGHWMGDQKFIISSSSVLRGRHVKPLVPAAFEVVSTHQSVLSPRGGLWPVLLMCSGDINRLMMMMMIYTQYFGTTDVI